VLVEGEAVRVSGPELSGRAEPVQVGSLLAELGMFIETQHSSTIVARTAVNAMRAAAALNPQSYTDPTLTPGTLIQAIHLTQLRTALDEARSTIGLPPLSYTDPTITPTSTTVKTAHITQLRDGVK